MRQIVTPFAGVPAEVTDAEAAALERMGMLRDEPPGPAAPAGQVTVRTVFGHDVTVGQAEATALARQGLIAEPAPGPLPVRTPAPRPAETTPAGPPAPGTETAKETA